ncbi:hypothetical protein BHE74_00054855 [Ensete ventricosum]|nr:hypothetical protein BHE74_00054855 [Ensete ventricosum]RZS15302.1 hypothetical protein BHM03_00047129 [Ensete ventricosum]
MVFNSCGTLCILLQEIVGFYKKMEDEKLDTRSIKRLMNVLILFQSVAANNDTRHRFVDGKPLVCCTNKAFCINYCYHSDSKLDKQIMYPI